MNLWSFCLFQQGQYARVEFECQVMLYEIRLKSLNKNTEYKDSPCWKKKLMLSMIRQGDNYANNKLHSRSDIMHKELLLKLYTKCQIILHIWLIFMKCSINI